MAERSHWVGADRVRLVLVLPEPPSLNEMLDIAKERRWSPRAGRAVPTVYNDRKRSYEALCDAVTRTDHVFPPREAWPIWQIDAVEIRRHNQLDVIEALASLKWPVDWLVRRGFVVDDSPRHLAAPPLPLQSVDRSDRGITLTIARRDP